MEGKRTEKLSKVTAWFPKRDQLTRNLDLTGGVRYTVQHDRLQTLNDDRRDSQAAYVGTAFRF